MFVDFINPHVSFGTQLFLLIFPLIYEKQLMMNLFLVRYYEGGILSVYMWEDDDQEGFSIKKGKHI